MTLVVTRTGDRQSLVPSVAQVPAQRRGWLQRRRDAQEYRERAQRLAELWSEVVIGLGLYTENPGVMGSTLHVPQVVSVPSVEPAVLLVHLAAGQSVADLAQHTAEIARHFGVGYARITPRAHRWARVELVSADPLSHVVLLDVASAGLRSAADPLYLGGDQHGRPVRMTLAEIRHMAIQGETGSGKSVFAYSLLCQLATAPDVRIAGCDVSGVLLRPFVGTRHDQWQACGSSLADHVTVLRKLEADMDRRLAGLPERSDLLDVSAGDPATVVFLEEYGALIGICPDKKAQDEVKRMVRRLVAEGRKVRMHVFVSVQRAEAAVVDGFIRAQLPTKVSFRVDSADAVVMLHPGARDQAVTHAFADDGVALMTAPKRPLMRLRAPLVVSYATYWDAIRQA